MRPNPAPYFVNVSLTLGGRPDHWLKREFAGKGRLRTACGNAEYLDGLGKPRRGQRDAYKITFGCSKCNAWIGEALRQHEMEERRSIYQHGTGTKDGVRSGGHVHSPDEGAGGYEDVDLPGVGYLNCPKCQEGKPLPGSGGSYVTDLLGTLTGEMTVANKPKKELKDMTAEEAVIDTLTWVNETMVRLWGSLPLADRLANLPGMESFAADLRIHQVGAIPILRGIATELQAQLDVFTRRKYNLPVTNSDAPRPKKG